MSIFKRLIPTTSSRKASVNSLDPDNKQLNAPDFSVDLSSLCWFPYKKLQRETLRLVVFCEQGNRLLYDSKTVISVNEKTLSNSKKSPCGDFYLLPHSGDSALISKMVFGTMATSLKTDSFKVHTLMNINALMVSRVFSVSTSAKPASPNIDSKCLASSISSNSDSHSHYSTIRSLDAIGDDTNSKMSSSKPSSYGNTDPPEGFTRLRNYSLQLDSKDVLSIELSAFSPNRLSRVRRRQLSLKGLNYDSNSYGGCLITRSRSRISSWSSMNDNISGQETIKQYGIALLFPGDDKDFVFQHILQIEKEIFKLIAQIHVAISTRAKFLKIVYEAWAEFSSAICLLHNALRLKMPVWLSLTNPLLQDQTATDFCRVLAKLSDELNTKDTKFFLSTLISSVLMNHLSWVASVIPPESCSFDRSLLLGTSVIESRRNPYNAIAAQFLELSGGIGVGNISAKTVVFGNDSKLIAEILYVLSYFVRCSSVDNKRKEMMTPDSLSPLKSFLDSSLLQESPLNSLFAEKKQTKNSLKNLKIFGLPEIKSKDNFYKGQYFLTSTPAKIRPVEIDFLNNYHSLRQRNCVPQRHYELILDAKVVYDSAAKLSNINTSVSSPLQTDANDTSSLSRPTDFGRSLLAGVCNSYSPHFVLSGIDKRLTNFEDAYLSIRKDLASNSETSPNLQTGVDLNYPCNLKSPSLSSASTSFASCGLKQYQSASGSQQNLVSTFAPESSICLAESQQSLRESGKSESENKSTTIVIAADCSNYFVKVISSDGCHLDDNFVVSPSESIASMLEEFVELYKHKCASAFLISFLEDRLSSLLGKSNVLVRLVSTPDEIFLPETSSDFADITYCRNFTNESFLSVNAESETHGLSMRNGNIVCNKCDFISLEHMSAILGCHCSDLRLILNVAAIYSPFVLSSVM